MRAAVAASSRPLLVAVFQLDQFVPEPATEEEQPKQTCPSHDIQQDIAGKVKKIHHLDDRACDCEREPQRYVKVIPTIWAACNVWGQLLVYVCHGWVPFRDVEVLELLADHPSPHGPCDPRSHGGCAVMVEEELRAITLKAKIW
jgi:hypothetical protein